jgi:hypothetical protein
MLHELRGQLVTTTRCLCTPGNGAKFIHEKCQHERLPGLQIDEVSSHAAFFFEAMARSHQLHVSSLLNYCGLKKIHVASMMIWVKYPAEFLQKTISCRGDHEKEHFQEN